MYLFEYQQMFEANLPKPTKPMTYSDGYEAGLMAAKKLLIQESSQLWSRRPGILYAVQVISALMKPSPDPDLC